MPLLSLLLEVHADQIMTAAPLTAYLGRKAGTQVLDGKVRRGSGERIEAVVLVADRRGFRGGSRKPRHHSKPGPRLDPTRLFFGNVGAAGRLDFTALGPVVNLAFRLEALTKLSGQPILVSAEFAAACPDRVAALGQHPVDRYGAMKPIFAPLPGR